MADERDRNERGQFEPEHSDEEVIAEVRKHQPAGTGEIAKELNIARQSADYRLKRLENEGKVKSKKIGGTLAWSVESTE